MKKLSNWLKTRQWGTSTNTPSAQKGGDDSCWNDEDGLCIYDAPRAATEIAAARAS